MLFVDRRASLEFVDTCWRTETRAKKRKSTWRMNLPKFRFYTGAKIGKSINQIKSTKRDLNVTRICSNKLVYCHRVRCDLCIITAVIIIIIIYVAPWVRKNQSGWVREKFVVFEQLSSTMQIFGGKSRYIFQHNLFNWLEKKKIFALHLFLIN